MLARSLKRMLIWLVCVADFVAQVQQASGKAPQMWLALLLQVKVGVRVPQVGLLARQADLTGVLWGPVPAASEQTRAVLSAHLRRAVLPAPMAVHPPGLLSPGQLALGLHPLEANSAPAAASVVGQRWGTR